MKVGDRVKFKGIEGSITGVTNSLIGKGEEIFFVMLDSGRIVEQPEDELTSVAPAFPSQDSMFCKDCVYYKDGVKYGYCLKRVRVSSDRPRAAYKYDLICLEFKDRLHLNPIKDGE